MMNNIKFNSQEISRILTLHENYKKNLIIEQSVERNRQEIIQFFAIAKSNGCLTDQSLKYDSPFRNVGETRAYISGPPLKSMPGMKKRVYDDLTFDVVNPSTKEILKSGKWSCKALEPKKEEPGKQEPSTKPKPLNKNQNDVLTIIKNQNWFHEPAPSDVLVDQGVFDKFNLVASSESERIDPTDPNAVEEDQFELNKYQKYFPSTDFKEFFVYRRKPKTITNTRRERAKVTGESCRAAIENLWNNVNNPKSSQSDQYTKEDIENDKFTAEQCAEPVNRSKFITRRELKNKLIDLSKSKHRINIGDLK